MKRSYLLVLLAMLLLLSPSAWGQPEGTAVWTRSGAPFGGPQSPVVGADGTVYAVIGWSLWSYSRDGDLQWKFQPSGITMDTSPCMGPDGTLYIGSSSTLYAVAPDGTLVWSFRSGGHRMRDPSVGKDGMILIWVEDDSLYAIQPDGSRKWAYKVPGGATGMWMGSSPVSGADGTAYVGSAGGTNAGVHAIRADGTGHWMYKTGSTVRSAPAVGPDGVVYAGTDDGSVHAIHSDGTRKWVYKTPSPVYSSPAVGPDGTVYVGSGTDGGLYALYPNGDLRWHYPAGGVYSSPAVRDDGVVYVGSSNGYATGYLHAVNPDGSRRWRYDAEEQVESSPAVGPDGTVYVASREGTLHAVSGGGHGLAATAWPRYHHDNRNTGNAQTPEVGFPEPVAFRLVDPGQPAEQPVAVKNTTTAPLHLVGFESADPLFTLSQQLPMTLEPGSDTLLTVRVDADTTRFCTGHVKVTAEVEGQEISFPCLLQMGLFVNDGSERAGWAVRALAAYEEAARVNPQSAASKNNRGVLYRLLGATTRAQSQLDAAMDMSFESGDSYAGILLNLGVVASDRNLTEEAGSLYDAVLDEVTQPETSVLEPQVRYNRAWEAYRDGDFALARTEIDRVLAHVSTNALLRAKASVLRGAILFDEGRLDEALADFQAAVALDPDGPIGEMARENRGLIVGAEEEVPGETLPLQLRLSEAFPNPFAENTTLRFGLPTASEVSLAVYDALGRAVRTLINAPVAAGWHQVDWDGRDEAGDALASGVYVLRLQARGSTAVRRVILLR